MKAHNGTRGAVHTRRWSGGGVGDRAPELFYRRRPVCRLAVAARRKQREEPGAESFGSSFATIACASEPRYRACAVTATCLDPSCHTIFEAASPTFKQRFMSDGAATYEPRFIERGSPHHSGLRPAALITFDHFAISARMTAANSSGVFPTGSAPLARKLFLTAGS